MVGDFNQEISFDLKSFTNSSSENTQSDKYSHNLNHQQTHSIHHINQSNTQTRKDSQTQNIEFLSQSSSIQKLQFNSNTNISPSRLNGRMMKRHSILKRDSTEDKIFKQKVRKSQRNSTLTSQQIMSRKSHLKQFESTLQQNTPQQNLQLGYKKYGLQMKILLFGNKLRKRTPSYRFKQLKNIFNQKYYKHLSVDKGSDIQHEIYASIFQIKLEKLGKFLDKQIKVLQPDNIFILIFNIIAFLFFFIEIWNIPLRFAFLENKHVPFYIVPYFNNIGYIIMFLKLIFSINTGYFHNGMITLNRDLIIPNYMKLQFWIDILCIIAIVVENRFVSIIFMIQILTLQNIYETIDMNYQISVKFSIITKLINLLVLILAVAHVCACGFLFIHNIDQDKLNSWVYQIEVQDETWEILYLHGVYFMVITMSTIGYGDISPNTVWEKIYGILISFLACGVFAFAVNMIGTIFQERSDQQAEYTAKKQYVLKFMNIRNISKQSQTKVLKFLEYQFQNQFKEGDLVQGQKIIDNLSKNIRDEVYKEFYFPILKQSEIMSIYFSNKFIEKLSLYFRESNLQEGENVYLQGSDDNNLYYVIKGKLEIFQFTETGTTIKGYIEPQSFFGYESFFLNNRINDENIRSQNFSSILCISQADLLEVVQQFPTEFENFKLVQEKLLSQKGNIRKCMLCNTLDHNIEQCNLVHYNPYQQKVIDNHVATYQIQQERVRYYRDSDLRTEEIFHARAGKIYYREDLIDVRKDIIIESKEYDNVHQIFELVQENEDDEQFYKFTPQIFYQNEQDNQTDKIRKKIKVQQLQDFLKDIEKENLELESQQKKISRFSHQFTSLSGQQFEDYKLQTASLNQSQSQHIILQQTQEDQIQGSPLTARSLSVQNQQQQKNIFKFKSNEIKDYTQNEAQSSRTIIQIQPQKQNAVDQLTPRNQQTEYNQRQSPQKKKKKSINMNFAKITKTQSRNIYPQPRKSHDSNCYKQAQLDLESDYSDMKEIKQNENLNIMERIKLELIRQQLANEEQQEKEKNISENYSLLTFLNNQNNTNKSTKTTKQMRMFKKLGTGIKSPQKKKNVNNQHEQIQQQNSDLEEEEIEEQQYLKYGFESTNIPFSTILNFDMCKIYQKYKPWNNYNIIIDQYNEKNQIRHHKQSITGKGQNLNYQQSRKNLSESQSLSVLKNIQQLKNNINQKKKNSKFSQNQLSQSNILQKPDQNLKNLYPIGHSLIQEDILNENMDQSSLQQRKLYESRIISKIAQQLNQSIDVNELIQSKLHSNRNSIYQEQ